MFWTDLLKKGILRRYVLLSQTFNLVPAFVGIMNFCARVVSACQKQPSNSGIFDGKQAEFSVSYYLRRIAKYSGTSFSCLMGGFLYLERLKARPTPLILTERNLQRLILVAVMTAHKFLEDDVFRFASW